MNYQRVCLGTLLATLIPALAIAQDQSAPAPAATVATVATVAEPVTPPAATVSPEIQRLQTRWAEIKYQLPEKEREDAFETLVKQAETERLAHPKDAPYLIWEGIIRSTYAGERGGLGALGEVKKAKVLFEEAIALAPEAMAGSAYTSLGSLYYQVPGWPMGFGDDDEAEAMLTKGLSYNPDGIDSNFFYGDFLLDQERYPQALAAFEKALKAPPRPGRELADQGRRAEIQTKIAEVRAEL